MTLLFEPEAEGSILIRSHRVFFTGEELHAPAASHPLTSPSSLLILFLTSSCYDGIMMGKILTNDHS